MCVCARERESVCLYCVLFTKKRKNKYSFFFQFLLRTTKKKEKTYTVSKFVSIEFSVFVRLTLFKYFHDELKIVEVSDTAGI